MIVAIDVSGSMNYPDWKPSRLDGAKEAFTALIDEKAQKRPHDCVGVVTYSNDARIHHIPTIVAGAASVLKKSVARLKAGGGTDIEQALLEAERALRQTDIRKRVGKEGLLKSLLGEAESLPSLDRRILLLTDGQHEASPGWRVVQAARRLKDFGVQILCIGIGDAEDVDAELLRTVASLGPNGNPLYWHISYKMELVKKFREVANGICIVEP